MFVRRLLAPTLVLSSTLFACALPTDPLGEPCNDLSLDLVDHAAKAPANVALRVRATCDGRALASRLTAADFTLLEDGRPLSTLEAERVVRPASRGGEQFIQLLLDLSGSVTRSGVRGQMVAGAKSLVSALGPGRRVAVMGFDGRAEPVPFVTFTDDAATLTRALDRLAESPTVDDSTNLNGAVLSALGALDDAVDRAGGEAHGALVVFTDGTDRAGRKSWPEVLDRLRFSSASVFAIGLGAELDEEVLRKLGRTGTSIARDDTELGAAFQAIADRVRDADQTDYLVGYCSPARAGRRTLEVQVKKGSMTGEVRTSFDATNFGAGCSPEAMPLP